MAAKRQTRATPSLEDQTWQSNVVGAVERQQPPSGKGNQLCRRCLLPNKKGFTPIQFTVIGKNNSNFKQTVILPQIYACFYYYTFYCSRNSLKRYSERFGRNLDLVFFLNNFPTFLETFEPDELDQVLANLPPKSPETVEGKRLILRRAKEALSNLMEQYAPVPVDETTDPASQKPGALEDAINRGILTEELGDNLFSKCQVAYIPDGGHVYFSEEYLQDHGSVEVDGYYSHVEKHSWYFDNRQGVVFFGGIRKYWGVDTTSQVKGVGTHLVSCLVQHLQGAGRKTPLRFLEIFPSFEVVPGQKENLIKFFALFSPLNRRVYTFYGLSDLALYLSRKKDYQGGAGEWLDTMYNHRIDLDELDDSDSEEEEDSDSEEEEATSAWVAEMNARFRSDREEYLLRREYRDMKNASLIVCAGLCLYLRLQGETLILDLFRLDKEAYKTLRPTTLGREAKNLTKVPNSWIQCSCTRAKSTNKLIFRLQKHNFKIERSALKRLYEWLRALAVLIFCRYHLDVSSVERLELVYDDQLRHAEHLQKLPTSVNSKDLHALALKMENYLSPLSHPAND